MISHLLTVFVYCRGAKGDVYEGGTRVPGLVHYQRYPYIYKSLPLTEDQQVPQSPRGYTVLNDGERRTVLNFSSKVR